jgi:tetratricopeptide (TPR) repeat protein
VRILAVLPFAADEVDPDANDLARWLAKDAAGALDIPGVVEPRLVVDRVEISAPALGEAAAQLGAEFALGATLQLADGRLELAATLVDASGAARAEWSESLPLGSAPWLGRMLARAVLLSLGEDASAAPESVESEVPGEAVLRLCRAARRIDEGELDEGVEDLLLLCEELPALEAARRTLLDAARAALGGDRMPAFFSALSRFVESRPGDAEALLLLGDFRATHLDEPGARELYLAARECAEDPSLSAEACGRLGALAEAAGRIEEAILHLRAAVKLHDDAAVYARLGSLLLGKEDAEGLNMLTRATVLAPDDPALHLALSRAIRVHGGDPSRGLAAAVRAAQLCPDQSELGEEIRTELELLLMEP